MNNKEELDTDEDLISKIDIKEVFSSSPGRYKLFGVYKVDKWIIQACMFLVFAFLFYVAWSSNFNLDFQSCNYDAVNNKPLMGAESCKNYFYTPTTWKNLEELPPGEYGTKPGPLFKSAWPVTLAILFLGFFINHLIYNRKNKTCKCNAIVACEEHSKVYSDIDEELDKKEFEELKL